MLDQEALSAEYEHDRMQSKLLERVKGLKVHIEQAIKEADSIAFAARGNGFIDTAEDLEDTAYQLDKVRSNLECRTEAPLG